MRRLRSTGDKAVLIRVMGSGERISTVSEAIKEQGGGKEGTTPKQSAGLAVAPVDRSFDPCRQ